MISYKKSLFVLIFISMLFVSCATSQFGWQPDNAGNSRRTSDSEQYVEDFDPLLLKEKEIVVEPEKKIETPKYNENSLESSHEESAEVVDEVQEVSGFTVQLVATGDETKAREFKRDAILKLSTDVYWIFESAMYKIRTGQFIERKDAETLLEEAKRRGFNDAWIVRTKVKVETSDSF